MSFYFAERCQSQDRLEDLYELTRNEELKGDCDITRLNDIIFSFLSDTTLEELNSPPKYVMRHVGTDLFKTNPRIRETKLEPRSHTEQSYIFSQNNEEKKECMKKLFESYLALPSPDVIYFSSEEIVSWIYDDPVFYNDFRAWCIELVNKGFSIVRIMKPLGNREMFLENLLLWFPMFMTGHVHLYYYPHYRDDIFRQTSITVKDSASYISGSLARTGMCYYSFFTSDPAVSDACIRQMKDYLAICRPSFYICKTEQEITDAYSQMMLVAGDRITKSYNISPECIPVEEMIDYLAKSDNEEYRAVGRNISNLYSAVNHVKSNVNVFDMCTLATPDEVRAGKVILQIPGFVNQTRIRYDLNLYVMHLKNILNKLENDPQYHFYELSRAEFGEYSGDYSPISVVENRGAILINERNVLHFVQPEITRTLYEHLYNQAYEHGKNTADRNETINRIRKLIAEFEQPQG
jgi:hypothetical protein